MPQTLEQSPRDPFAKDPFATAIPAWQPFGFFEGNGKQNKPSITPVFHQEPQQSQLHQESQVPKIAPDAAALTSAASVGPSHDWREGTSAVFPPNSDEVHPASEEAHQPQALASAGLSTKQPPVHPCSDTHRAGARPVHAVPSSADAPQETPPLAGPDVIVVVRPYLGAAHCWIASVPSGEFGHGGANVLSRCGLRIFRNGNLGRSVEWAVLITEFERPSDQDVADLDRGIAVFAPEKNFGVPAIVCLEQLAEEIKRTHLPRAPIDQITWFYHQPRCVSKMRPIPHHQLGRIDYRSSTRHGRTTFHNHLLVPCAPEELEMAAGGCVQL